MKECIRFAPNTIGFDPFLFYFAGFENTAITGGLVKGKVSGNYLQTKETDYLYLEATGSSAVSSFVTSNKIDFSNLSKIKVLHDLTNASDPTRMFFLYVSDNPDGVTSYVARVFGGVNGSFVVLELDVSAINGEHYVSMFLGSQASASGTYFAKIYKFWGEK